MAVLSFLLVCPLAGPQSVIPFPQQSPSANPRGPSTLGENQPGQMDPVLERKRQQRLNVERQKEMVSDTAKLLKLAQEFNADAAHEDASDGTSERQMRRLGEIAKLARSVKDKMSYGLGGTAPSFESPGPLR
jgi:hypothetical protein